MSRALTAAAVVALALSAPAGARATAPADHLDRARVCYEALDYACARDELARARSAHPDGLAALDDPTAAAVLQLSAEVALALDDRAAAVDHLVALLDRAPRFAPPDGAWPPRWLAALDEARRRAPDRDPPTVDGLPPSSPLPAGRAARVTARITDDGGVARAVLHLARPDGSPLAFAMLSDGGAVWHADLPAELVAPPSLALWVEAWDRAGNGPGRWASADAPARLPVDPTGPTGPTGAPTDPDAASPITSRWWFWTAIGAAVVTGVVLAVVLTADDDPAEPAAALGDARVILTFPD